MYIRSYVIISQIWKPEDLEPEDNQSKYKTTENGRQVQANKFL